MHVRASRNHSILLYPDLAAAVDSGETEVEEDLGLASTPGAGTPPPPPPGLGTQGGPATRMVFPEKLKRNYIS